MQQRGLHESFRQHRVPQTEYVPFVSSKNSGNEGKAKADFSEILHFNSFTHFYFIIKSSSYCTVCPPASIQN